MWQKRLEAGEQRTNVRNVARFAATHPRGALVMARKVLKRLADTRGRHSEAENRAWLASRSQNAAEVARSLAPDLWAEAVEFHAAHRARVAPILTDIPHDLESDQADYRFLYWLTRLRQPEVVVETGVAAGWSSQSFLAALKRNGRGSLYSSDFPYFRLRNAESRIGCVVDDELREDWELYLNGDEFNLPRILARVPEVDLFHYDSDKTYSGRAFAVGLVREKLAPGGLIVMDDLSDNSWFYDEVERSGSPFSVFDGRFGAIGRITPDGVEPRR